ncbi:MAG TPA: lysophospholipid acyltransferase family protein [Thermoanaerobaculia bacterium]|nr:lysophospholipid acyltransferase family protein [Thermoanaerobaculia bacterium]
MQEKMSSRNRLVRALASGTSYVWFPAALFVARYAPRRIARWVARTLGQLYFRFRPKYVQAVRANLSVILGQPSAAAAVEGAADGMFRGHFAAWFDFLHFATRPAREASRLIEGVDGFSRIVEGRLRGKGVLLLTAHLGNWEVGSFMLAEIRLPIHVVLVPDIFPGVERARRKLHQSRGVTEIPVDHSFVPTLSVMRALEENGIVAMQGDRDFDNTGVAVPFFGREAYFPRGPFRVAMATEATVLPAFILETTGSRYRAVIEEPLSIVRGPDRDTALAANISRYVALLERYVRENPAQWYCFYPFWDDPSRRPEVGG